MFLFETFLVFFIGCALGSFSSALIYRIPNNIVWWGTERSKCTSCNTVLSFLDLIPIFSWLASKGKCRHCGEDVHYKYPLIECLAGVLFICAYVFLGFTGFLFFLMLALPFLLALFFIDLEKMILPNQLVIIVFCIGLLRLFFLFPVSDYVHYILSAFFYGAVIWGLALMTQYILKKEALGFGDVKFFIVSGLWLGFSLLPYFMILSGILAVAFSLIWSKSGRGSVFPFGPSLIMSFYLLLLFGDIFI